MIHKIHKKFLFLFLGILICSVEVVNFLLFLFNLTTVAEQTLWPFTLNRVHLPQDGDTTAKLTLPVPIPDKEKIN